MEFQDIFYDYGAVAWPIDRIGTIGLSVFYLNAGKFAPVDLVVSLKAIDVPVLGFLSHVNVELKEKAVEAGADRVLARSALAQNINAIFKEFAGAA